MTGKTGVYMFKRSLAAALLCLFAAACASASPPPAPAQTGFQSLGTDLAAVRAANAPPTEYRLGPFDKISVSVYQMPDLSFPELQVGATGQIVLPQVGPMPAAGKTTGELAFDVATKLAQCCLVNPQVIVTLREAVSQQVTVTGAVKSQGVISLRGRTTLQQVIAMAGGADTSVADMKSVAVIRVTNGQRMGAKFNLEEIMKGAAPDPEVMAGDTVVVDASGSKSTFKNVLQAIPLVGIFTLF